MNRRSQGYEPCEIPLLYPAIYVSFQHICTGNSQADCFLHLGQHPHTLFSYTEQWERWDSNPRAIWPYQTFYRQSLHSHNPDSRVSKVFYVLCLNTRRFGLRQRRLYGQRPLRWVEFRYSVICSQGGMPPCTNGNDTCRKLHPLFNLMLLVLAKHCIFY